jgi:Electron transfer flavoprotein, alpha subunit
MKECEGSCSSGTCGDNDECRLPPGMLNEYDLDLSVAEGVLIWIQIEKIGNTSKMDKVSAEILGRISEIYDDRIMAVIFGDIELKPVYESIFSLGVKTIYHVKDRRLIEFDLNAYCGAVSDLVERVVPAAILMGATENGNRLSSKLAMIFNTKSIEDCTQIDMNGRSMTVKKHGESMGYNKYPQIATVVPGSYSIPAEGERRKGTVIYRQYNGII